MANILLPKHFNNGIILEPVSADPANPVAGQQQFSDGTHRAVGTWAYSGSEWVLPPAPLKSIVEVSSDGNIAADTDFEVITMGGVSISRYLPDATAFAGRILTIQLSKSGYTPTAMAVYRTGSDTIEGGTQTLLWSDQETIVLTPLGTDWKILRRDVPQVYYSYTPTVSNFGTITNNSATFYRDRKHIHVKGQFSVTSSPSAAMATVSLPSGVGIATAEFPSSQAVVGQAGRATASTNNDYSVISYAGIGDVVGFGIYQVGTAHPFQAVNANQLVTSGDFFFYNFKVPVSNWEG